MQTTYDKTILFFFEAFDSDLKPPPYLHLVTLCLPVVGKKLSDLTKSGGSPPFLQPCSSPFYFTLKARSFESKPCVLLRCTYSQLSFP